MICPKLNFYEENKFNGLVLYEFDDAGDLINFNKNDETGIAGMNYLGSDYIFEKNILGDVVGIYNAQTGVYMGGYMYDAWGNILSQTNNTIVNINPFRYRGYYYDSETQLYYLNSRYYDPAIGRFLNADEPASLLYTASVPFGANLYAYCADNPIAYTDRTGSFFLWDWIVGGANAVGKFVSDNWEIAVGVAVIAGLGIATVCTGGAAAVVLGVAFKGALIGGMIGAGTGALTGVITGDWSSFGSSFMWGAIGGGLSGGFSKFGELRHIAVGWQIATQIGVSMGMYVGQTMATGQKFTPGGFAFAFIGGFAGGCGLPQNSARTVTGLLGLYTMTSNLSKHYGLWVSGII